MRIYDIGAKDGPEEVSDRVLTVANVLSFLRLLALPIIYLDLVRGSETHWRAFVLLTVFVLTDWIDGYVARRFDQVTRIGKLLDPIADRLLMIVVGFGMVQADLVPLWIVLVILARDLVVLVGGIVMVRKGMTPPAVTRIGKSATFGLMFALPAFILASVLGDGPADPQPVLQWIAWFSLIVNTILYYVAAGQYARVVVRATRSRRRGDDVAAVMAEDVAPGDIPEQDGTPAAGEATGTNDGRDVR